MGLPSRDYELIVRQEPKQARMCGLGGKADRRPIDPPPIVQLRVIERTPTGEQTNVGQQAFLQNPYYFMFASLAHHETDEELHLLKDGKTRCTTGSIVSSLYHLKDAENHNQDAGFFVFPDLSVRTEGSYRLKFTLFEVIGPNVHHCKSLYSKAFYVYTAKKFPGMEESTRLSCSLADQGIKIRIRKDIRVRKRPVQADFGDGDDPDMDEGTLAEGPGLAGPSRPQIKAAPSAARPQRPSVKRRRADPEPVSGPAPPTSVAAPTEWPIVPHSGQPLTEPHPPPPPPPAPDRDHDLRPSATFPTQWGDYPNPRQEYAKQPYDIYPSPTSHISPYGPPSGYPEYPSAAQQQSQQQQQQQQQQQTPGQYPSYPVSPPRGHPPPPPAAGPSPRDSYNYSLQNFPRFDSYGTTAPTAPPTTRTSGPREYSNFPPQPQQAQQPQTPQSQYPPPAMASPPHAPYGYISEHPATTRAPSAPAASSTYGPGAAATAAAPYTRAPTAAAPAPSAAAVGWQTAVPGPSYTYHRSPEPAPQMYERQLNDSREDLRYRDPSDAAPRHTFLPSPPDHRRHPHAPPPSAAPHHHPHDPSAVDHRVQLAPLRVPGETYPGFAIPQAPSQNGAAGSAGGDVRDSSSPVGSAYATGAPPPPVHQSTRYGLPLSAATSDPQSSHAEAFYPIGSSASAGPYHHPRDYADKEHDLRGPPPSLMSAGLHHERMPKKRNALSIGSILQ